MSQSRVLARCLSQYKRPLQQCLAIAATLDLPCVNNPSCLSKSVSPQHPGDDVRIVHAYNVFWKTRLGKSPARLSFTVEHLYCRMEHTPGQCAQ